MAATIRILYVDDELSLLDIGKQFLEKSGEFAVTTVLNAPDAIRLLEQEKFDAIISDYQMPEMDGIQFLIEVRSRFGPIPFILFTGRGREEIVIQAINSGADFYLQKGGEPKSQFAELSHKIMSAASRKRAEDALRESEAQLTAIIQSSPIPKFVIDKDHRVIHWNKALEGYSGIKEKEIIGTNQHWRAFYKEERPCMADLILDGAVEKFSQWYAGKYAKSKLIEGAYEATDFFPHMGKAGTWLFFTASVIKDDDGNILGAIETLEDSTETHLKTEELNIAYNKIQTAFDLVKESEEQYRNIVEDQTEFISRFLPDGTHIFVNDAYCRYFGVAREVILGHRFRPVIHSDDCEAVAGFFATLTLKNPVGIIDQRTIMPDGSTRWQRWSDRAIFDADGKVMQYQSVGRDITEYKQAEEALKESEEQLHLAIDGANLGLWDMNLLNGEMVHNQRWAEMLGFSMDELEKPSEWWGQRVHHEDYQNVLNLSNLHRAGKVPFFDAVYRMKHKNGEWRWVHSQGKIISRDRDGVALRMIGVNQDITGQKLAELDILKKNEELKISHEQIAAAEEELRANIDEMTRGGQNLRESEEKYRTLVEKANEAIMIAQDDVFVFANRRMSELLGVTAAELEGRPFIDFIWPEDRKLVIANYRMRISGETISDAYDFRILGAGGRLIWVFISAAAIQWKGKPATLNLITDITDRKQAEDALRESEEKLRLKLDSVLSPAVDLDEQELANIIDTVLIQSLMDDFFAVTGMPIGIVDLKGNVLVKTGWQGICKKFHRVHPETSKNCIESNLTLSSGVPKGEFHAYRCSNNMWDIVTPIFIGDKHIGNLFCGQFFYEDEVPDTQVFITQSEKYGFDKDRYLAALNSVPRWSREKIKNTMQFYAKFAELVSKLSYSNLKLAKMISTQKLVEISLVEQEEQSRMLLSSMPDIVMVHHDGIIVYANQMALDKTGFSEEELIGSHIFDHVKETDREIILRNMKKRAAGELVGEYEIDMIHKSGLLHQVIIRTSPIVFNQLPSVVFIIIDITERKNAEKALKESEEKYRLIFENSPLGHLSFDEKGIIVACNDKFIQIIGSSRDALIGLNMLNLPDKNIVSAVQKALSGYHGLYEGVYSSVTAKKITPVRGLFAPMDFGEGRIPGGMGIFEDITERKVAEEALQESELKYRSLIDSSSDAIFCVDKNGEYKFTNLVFASTFDKTPEYFIKKTFWDIYPKEQADYRQLTNLKLFETGVTQTIEVEVPLPDTTLFFIAKANPIKDETGKVILNLTHATDITDRKRAERAIQQANQKLLLLSSITRHDINNQLTVLQGYLELVEMKQEDHNLIDYCQKAITAAQRIYAMIRFTKEYETLGISAPAWHDTRTLIETTAKQAPLGKVIVKNDIPAGPEVFADPLIIKVCYNLMDNAVQYGKKITTIRFSVLKRNDEHLIVCEDDGMGVLAEEKEKIFERGFGKNTGLGLALSREILSITGITIRETGEPGKGARFEMTVPKVMWRTVRKKE